MYAWENPGVPVDEVVSDILQAFHHPTLRRDGAQLQRDMFNTVKKWADEHPRRHQLDQILSSDSVRNGKNHVLNQQQHGQQQGHNYHGGSHSHSHGALESMLGKFGHGKVAGSLWSQVRTRDLDAMEGRDGEPLKGSAPSPAAPQQSFDYGTNPAYQQGQGGYNAPPPQPGPYYSGYGAPSPGPPPHGYAAPPGPPPQGYAQEYAQGYVPPPGPPQHGYGAPPPGQPGYGPPGGPPPGWQQYPGQQRRY